MLGYGKFVLLNRLMEEIGDRGCTINSIGMPPGEEREIPEIGHEGIRFPSQQELDISGGKPHGMEEDTRSHTKGMATPSFELLEVTSLGWIQVVNFSSQTTQHASNIPICNVRGGSMCLLLEYSEGYVVTRWAETETTANDS